MKRITGTITPIVFSVIYSQVVIKQAYNMRNNPV
jgi:hypothetical protein